MAFAVNISGIMPAPHTELNIGDFITNTQLLSQCLTSVANVWLQYVNTILVQSLLTNIFPTLQN
jgi:hypothetical protein